MSAETFKRTAIYYTELEFQYDVELREIERLRAELQSLSDIAEAAWRFPGEDALRKLHRAVQSARRALRGA